LVWKYLTIECKKIILSCFLQIIDELDISDIRAVIAAVRRIKPDVIINCAAYTAVDDCETKTDTVTSIMRLDKNLAIASLETRLSGTHINRLRYSAARASLITPEA
jgi:dTDP-4-dehydrorhamnose reductase